VAIFGALSLHQKIPFPAAGIEPEVRPQLPTRNSVFWGIVIWGFGLALKLFRIKSEQFKLPAPFSRGIAEPLDTDAAGQATFYGCFDKIGCQEGERDRHIDLPNAALLAGAKLSDGGDAT
jgi:hypothetical protein